MTRGAREQAELGEFYAGRHTGKARSQRLKPPDWPGVGRVGLIWNGLFRIHLFPKPVSRINRVESKSEIPHDLEIKVGIGITPKQC